MPKVFNKLVYTVQSVEEAVDAFFSNVFYHQAVVSKFELVDVLSSAPVDPAAYYKYRFLQVSKDAAVNAVVSGLYDAFSYVKACEFGAVPSELFTVSNASLADYASCRQTGFFHEESVQVLKSNVGVFFFLQAVRANSSISLKEFKEFTEALRKYFLPELKLFSLLCFLVVLC